SDVFRGRREGKSAARSQLFGLTGYPADRMLKIVSDAACSLESFGSGMVCYEPVLSGSCDPWAFRPCSVSKAA
ncbi:hypothetical protein BaRGS_00011271, partial [Batillaria attramentaria]